MYLWTQQECAPAALASTLNRMELEGWEVFQILPGARPIIVANRPAEREEIEDALQAMPEPPASLPGLEGFSARVRLGPEEAWWQEALQLIQAGRKIQAIKLVREHTGMDLKDSKRLVDDHLLARPSPRRNPMDDEARALVQAGRKILAIKLVRDHTGMGLREAKAYVEAL